MSESLDKLYIQSAFPETQHPLRHCVWVSLGFQMCRKKVLKSCFSITSSTFVVLVIPSTKYIMQSLFYRIAIQIVKENSSVQASVHFYHVMLEANGLLVIESNNLLFLFF